LKAVARREIDMVAAWSVDRLGRNLMDLLTLLKELHAKPLRHDALKPELGAGWRRPSAEAPVGSEQRLSKLLSKAKTGIRYVEHLGRRWPDGIRPRLQDSHVARAILLLTVC
jgi:hypothetical protein